NRVSWGWVFYSSWGAFASLMHSAVGGGSCNEIVSVFFVICQVIKPQVIKPAIKAIPTLNKNARIKGGTDRDFSR
ncbi:hypothetical protein L2E81_22555, partial [Planktothrix agardhii 1033]|nr:hypothetical protein [Planktothrix agardhii 1033]